MQDEIEEFNGVAIDYALSWGIDVTWNRIKTLADRLRASLLNLEFVDLCDLGKERCGIVTFTVQGVDSALVQRKLAEDKINVTVSLEEYSRLDLTERGIKHLVRASVHYYNTEEEIERFCHRLATIV